MFGLRRHCRVLRRVVLLGLVTLFISCLAFYNSGGIPSSDVAPIVNSQSVTKVTEVVMVPVTHLTVDLDPEIEVVDTEVLSRPEFREDVYDQLLVDAESAAHTIKRQSLKTFWMTAVDLRQYEKSIETLDSIISSPVVGEALIADAQRYREDLVKLSQPVVSTSTTTVMSESVENVPLGDESDTYHESLDPFRLDELAYTLRHGEPEQVSSAIEALSLHRSSQVTDLLLQNLNFLPTTQYRKVLRTLWFSAADGIDAERIKTYIGLAQYSDDQNVVELAELAYVDLQQAEEPAVAVQEDHFGDPATGCVQAECWQ